MAFVIMRLLPSLGGKAELVRRTGVALPLPAGESVYAMVLFSLLLFYGAEMLTRRSSPEAGPAGSVHVAALAGFRVELGTFALLDFLIGFTLLHRAREGGDALLAFFLAMFLKFVVTDHALQQQHQRAYERLGRWVLAAAVLVGWGFGALIRLPVPGPALLEAFIAGGVIFNVLRWELPRGRQSRYWPFALGAVAYSALSTVL